MDKFEALRQRIQTVTTDKRDRTDIAALIFVNLRDNQWHEPGVGEVTATVNGVNLISGNYNVIVPAILSMADTIARNHHTDQPILDWYIG